MVDDLLNSENNNPDDDFMKNLANEGNMKDEELNRLPGDLFKKNKDSKQWKREYRSISNFTMDSIKEAFDTEYEPKLNVTGSKAYVNSDADIINTMEANITPIPECQDKECGTNNKCKKCKLNTEKLFSLLGKLSLNAEELGIENKITFVPQDK
tara:strand:- start:760 stop:1221 length:462 start_codon:yes stop_codon:yes gene_type:complete